MQDYCIFVKCFFLYQLRCTWFFPFCKYGVLHWLIFFCWTTLLFLGRVLVVTLCNVLISSDMLVFTEDFYICVHKGYWCVIFLSLSSFGFRVTLALQKELGSLLYFFCISLKRTSAILFWKKFGRIHQWRLLVLDLTFLRLILHFWRIVLLEL